MSIGPEIERLYKENYNEFYLMARKYLYSKEDAEDIVQNAFIWAYENEYKFVPKEATISTWIKTRIRWRALQLLDKKKELRIFDDFQANLEDKKKRSNINLEIDSFRLFLSKTEYSIFELYILGHNHEDIGKELNIPAWKSKRLYYKAIKKCKELLESEGDTQSLA